MRCVFPKLSAALLACLVSLSNGPVASAQQGNGSISITGKVSPALKLSIAEANREPLEIREAQGVRAAVRSEGLESAQIELTADDTSKLSRLTIPIEIRTNVAYELKLTLLSNEGCAPRVTTSVGSIYASGAAVAAMAAESSRRSGPIDLARESSTALVVGPRVSAGGNFTSPNNAIRMSLSLDFQESSAVCGWHAVIRVSLAARQSF
jgi:hypothetical protein